MKKTSRNVIFSSVNQNWKTPKAIYDRLNNEFNFDFDPCPSNPTFNGLHIPWKKRNFVNPPYNEVAKWIRKAWIESLKGKIVVLLTASRTDTQWFHKYVLPYAKEIRFLKGRIKFNNEKKLGKTPAPFPSIIIVFDGKNTKKSRFILVN